MEQTAAYNAPLETVETRVQRFAAVDIAKGILIIAVVFSHAWFANADLLGNWFPYSMPAFFFLSGYTYKPGRGYLFNLRRRAVQLLLPYLFFSIAGNLLFPLYVSLSAPNPPSVTLGQLWLATLKSDAMNMLMGTPMWFLTALFTGSLIFFALADKTRDSFWKTLAAVVVLLGVTLLFELIKKKFFTHEVYSFGMKQIEKDTIPWHIDYAPFGAAMMLLGAYCGRKKLYALLTVKSVVCGLVCLAVCYMLNRFFPGSGKTSVCQYIEGDAWYGVLTAFAIAVTGSIGILMFSRAADFVPGLRQLLSWCGRNSIWILCIHYVFIMLIELKLFNLHLLSNSIMQVVAVALFGFGTVVDTPRDIVLKAAVAIVSIGCSAVYAVIHSRVKAALKARKP